jgi:hypothetical protein
MCNYKLIKNSKHLQEHVALIPAGVRKPPIFESRQSEVAPRDQESEFHAEGLAVVLLTSLLVVGLKDYIRYYKESLQR